MVEVIDCVNRGIEFLSMRRKRVGEGSFKDSSFLTCFEEL